MQTLPRPCKSPFRIKKPLQNLKANFAYADNQILVNTIKKILRTVNTTEFKKRQLNELSIDIKNIILDKYYSVISERKLAIDII